MFSVINVNEFKEVAEATERGNARKIAEAYKAASKDGTYYVVLSTPVWETMLAAKR